MTLLPMIDPRTEIGKTLNNQYNTVRDQVKNQGTGLLLTLTTDTDQEIAERIESFINPVKIEDSLFWATKSTSLNDSTIQ